MRTIEVKIYQFHELSDKAKEKALNEFICDGISVDWICDEGLPVIKKCLEYFDFKLSDWSIDLYNINGCSLTIKSELTLDAEELKGIRLWKYLQNRYNLYLPHKKKQPLPIWERDCVLTGLTIEGSFMGVISAFMKKPCKYTSFSELMENAAHAVLKDMCNDYEYQTSEKAFAEHCQANEYEFTEKGERI